MSLRKLILILLASVVTSGPALALTDAQRQMVQYDAVYYDASGNDCLDYNVIGAGTQTGVWDSGLAPPYILQEFMIEVLKDVAAKTSKPVADTVTKEHLLALVAFALGEGGDINNNDVYNPLNTGIDAPELVSGAHAGNGVQSFKTFDAGVEATARALTDGNHTRLATALTDPKTTAEQFMYALTYFQKYPGNAIWAEASLPPNQDNYYRRQLSFVQSARSQYQNIAGLVIGTPAKEQIENQTDLAKLDTNLIPDGASTTPKPSNDISINGGACGAPAGGQ